MISAHHLRRAYEIYRSEGTRTLAEQTKTWCYYRLPVEIRLRLVAWSYYVRGNPGIGNPLRIYEVPPTDIDQGIPKKRFGHDVPEFGIVGGNWHERAVDLDERGMPNMLVEHFEDGTPWRDTDHYHDVVEYIRNGDSYGPFDASKQTVSNYEEYLSYIDDLYTDIKHEGYKRQEELESTHDFLSREIHPVLNEIQVFIGPEGEFMCKSGAHRLTIAKILKLESVPVRTQVRHTQWQEVRNEIATADHNTGFSSSGREYKTHPEIQDTTTTNRFSEVFHLKI